MTHYIHRDHHFAPHLVNYWGYLAAYGPPEGTPENRAFRCVAVGELLDLRVMATRVRDATALEVSR